MGISKTEEQKQWDDDFLDEIIKICRKEYCPSYAAKIINKVLFTITGDDQ